MSAVEPINNYGTYVRRGGATTDRRAPGAEAVSRYDRNRSRARFLGEPAQMPRSPNADTVTAAVQDPYGDGKERVLATVNRRVDILETERSHGRISEAAYLTGREIQAIFERMGSVSGTNWGGTSRVDAEVAREMRMIKSVDQAAVITAKMTWMSGRLGMIDARLTRRILGDRQTYAQCATLEGKAGERGTTYIAMRFRDALESLAVAATAKGPAAAAVDDKHSAAFEAAPERQVTSMKAGVTSARRKREGA